MAKFPSGRVQGHNLARQLTRERLKRSGLGNAAKPSSDPDLERFRQVLRSEKSKTRSSSVSQQVVKKLA